MDAESGKNYPAVTGSVLSCSQKHQNCTVAQTSVHPGMLTLPFTCVAKEKGV